MKFVTIEKNANTICKIILIIISLYYSYLIIKSGLFENENVQELFVLFFLMIFEGLPFILIGSVVAVIINLYVSDKVILKIISGNSFLNIITASFTGLLFPICECGIVPVIRKLLDKKLPLHIAITVMVSVPIVNPVVILTTFLAFPGRIDILFLRAFSGILISISTGLLVYLIYNNKSEEKYLKNYDKCTNSTCTCHSCFQKKKGFIDNLFIGIDHIIREFYSMGRYYIIGSFLTAFLRACIPQTIIYPFMENKIASVFFMIIMAYCLSVCSESDAFIARKFIGIFPDIAIIGFLVFGPMSDFKNTVLLLDLFKKRFVCFLVITIFILCFLNSLILSMII